MCIRDRFRAARPSEPSAKCGKPAASLIPRWGMSWACVLDKGHEGECAPGGNCIKHGPYVCKPNDQPKCPKWPDCCMPEPSAPKVEPRKSIAQTVRDAYNNYFTAYPGWEDEPGALEELRDTVEWLLETVTLGLNLSLIHI